ncbi:MAG TPA: sugar kinase [Bacteroidia bacterium]
MTPEYAIIVKSKTRLESLIERFNTKSQAQFYIERSGGSWSEYEREHNTFYRSLSLVQQQVSSLIKNKLVEKSFLPSFIFNEKQVVIVVGQDGLVANTAKYVNGIPILAINPDPSRYDGALLPFHADSFSKALQSVLNDDYTFRNTTLAEARLNDGQRLLAFNDLFIGAATHVSARYKISFGGNSEEHSSSGILVSTRSGSTGWLSSVYNMTCAISHLSETSINRNVNEEQLVFVVREPFKSQRTQTGIVTGNLNNKTGLVIESFMPANGVIFSDGIENDFLAFNSGSIATIGIAKEKAKLVL